MALPAALPPVDPTYDDAFTPGFLRKVLALGIRAGLNKRIPGALLPALFAGVGTVGRHAPPRQRLALLLEQFEKHAPGQWPGNETMDLLVDREGMRLQAEEAGLLKQEWAEVRILDIPDPAYVEHEVREWVGRQSLQRALLSAADLYQQGAPSADVRSHLMKAIRESDPLAHPLVPLIATYQERVEMWEKGQDRGVAVPTGLRGLDKATNGGVRLGEVFYIIGPPKGAKTAFLLNVALNGSRRRFGGVLFSFEMGNNPMLFRMDRNVAHASKQELRTDARRLDQAYRGLIAAGAGEVWVWTGSPQQRGACEEVQRVVEDLRREGQMVDFIVLDFLNIMGASREEREKRHELARISREIAQVTKELEVATWSGTLCNRAAVKKARIRKDDIAEAFEVVAVADGMVAVCAPEELLVQGKRSLYLAALREEGDERMAGVYNVDLDRMTFVESREADMASARETSP